MWKQIKPLLIMLSVALNLAFLGVWLVYAGAARVESWAKPCVPGDSETIWCPLHRELNVTADQWKEIEPRLRAFRASADEICNHISQLRMEIINMLAAPDTDLSKVKVKQEEIVAGQRKMQGLVIEQLLSEKTVLTAEQERRFFEMLRSRSGCDHGPLLVPGRGHEGSLARPLRTGGNE
jgi:Spy/CpxP family protein refolding chaperone